MADADLIAALLLPLPPWLGFWIFRRKGRVGLSYGYFLGGILALLALPWAHLTGLPVPTAQLGGALFGFTLYLQAQREGAAGIRRLAVGVGGATLFLLLLLLRLRLPWVEVFRFWFGAAVEAVLWLVCSDLAYRWTRGRNLELRMPMVGAVALGLGALAHALLPSRIPGLSWPAAILGGLLLGLVALQQLRWLRDQGAWVEGRGQGLRLALALLEPGGKAESPALALGLAPRQALWLVDDAGRVLESNGLLSRLVGLPRYRLRGYPVDSLFQGGETPVWEAIRSQILQFGCAKVPATQVSDDGSFSQVTLEAVAFDRGMALLWLVDPSPGALQLRGGTGLHQLGGGADSRRLEANARLALSAAIERLSLEPPDSPMGPMAGLAKAAAARLTPPPPMPEGLEAKPLLESLLPSLQRLLPSSGAALSLRVQPLPLRVEAGHLQRIATQLLLLALERNNQGELTLALDGVDLGGRGFALLHVEGGDRNTPQARPLFGLGWLRQAVVDAGGLLELEQDLRSVHPRVYLPVAASPRPLTGPLLKGRTLWVVDRDPLVREALTQLICRLGGQAQAFEGLRQLLHESRDGSPPHALVLERTARLERFHGALRAFQKVPIPTLVLGMGQPLPMNPAALGLQRLGFLDKPFEPDEFARSVLALLRGPVA